MLNDESVPTITHDIAGPRFTWATAENETVREYVECYAGEWVIRIERLGPDCCWREIYRARLSIGEALDALPKVPGAVAESWAAKAHMHYANVLGNVGMRLALDRALKARGLRRMVASAA